VCFAFKVLSYIRAKAMLVGGHCSVPFCLFEDGDISRKTASVRNFSLSKKKVYGTFLFSMSFILFFDGMLGLNSLCTLSAIQKNSTISAVTS